MHSYDDAASGGTTASDAGLGQTMGQTGSLSQGGLHTQKNTLSKHDNYNAWVTRVWRGSGPSPVLLVERNAYSTDQYAPLLTKPFPSAW